MENIVVKHILERKRLENALFETRNELNSLIDSVPGGIGVWKVTDKVQVEYFNDGFCRQFGYDREEFQEKFTKDLTVLWVGGDTEYILKRLRENQDSSDRISLVHQVRRKDQILRWFSLNALKYKEEDGVPVYRIVNIDVTESRENELLIEQKNEELRYLLEHDALTGLYNRSTFCRKTADFLRQNPNGSYNMVQFDIERFKVINELYGNFMGDRILLLIAEGLQKCLKDKGTYGRLEADHFAVCLPAGTEELQYVREQMDKSLASVKIEQKINLYYGVYTVEDRDMSVDLMCDRANLALRTVKGNSNRSYAVYNDELHQVVLSEQQLTNSMEEALLQRQFEVYYQPVVDLKTGEVVEAGMVIVSAGIRANIELAKKMGLETKKGVVVNERMETSVSGIYACGDCAQYHDGNYGIWPEAVEQGKTAGANAAGDSLEYMPVPAALTFHGMNTALFAAGDNGRNPNLLL